MTLVRTMAGVLGGLVVGAVALTAQGTAKGTATYKSTKGAVTVTFTHAAAVAGPDVMGAPIRRLVLSTTDVSAALQACQTMLGCSDGGIKEGLTLDLGEGPRHGFWFVANDQRVQHSGVVRPETVALTTDSPTRLAGTFTVDQQSSGGPVVQVTFDAPIVKTLAR